MDLSIFFLKNLQTHGFKMGCFVRNLMILVLTLSAAVSCAPVKFSKANNAAKNNSKQDIEPTMLGHYLDGDVTREYMIAWIFSDSESFRGTIYDINYEIAQKENLSNQEIDRILALEYDLNRYIHRFNDQGFFSKAYGITASFTEKFFRDEDYTLSIGLRKLENEGVDPMSISDSHIGVLNSVFVNGFNFEEVDLLCRRTCDRARYIH